MRQQTLPARGMARQRLHLLERTRPTRVQLPGHAVPRKLLMQPFTAFTNLYTDTDTLRDIKQRGRAVRLHPDPMTAAEHSRPDDTIVEVSFLIPDGATFMLYTWEKDQFVIFGTGPDFTAAYAAAQKTGGNADLSTAVSIAGKSAGTAVIPVARYATALSPLGATERDAA
jgi:hypothetical protein